TAGGGRANGERGPCFFLRFLFGCDARLRWLGRSLPGRSRAERCAGGIGRKPSRRLTVRALAACTGFILPLQKWDKCRRCLVPNTAHPSREKNRTRGNQRFPLVSPAAH